MTTSDPIIAIATAQGRGGVGVIRLSAPTGVLPKLAAALLPSVVALRPRYAHYTPFNDLQGVAIDQGLVLWFPAPHSYTGEDVLELQVHGGAAVLQLLLSRCLEISATLSLGLRIANAGEFTQRAFLNHKLDLAQAEAVADLIEANTASAARAATHAMQGAFSKEVNALVERITHLRMLVEATLDFPEEEIEFLENADAKGQLRDIQMQLQRVLATCQQGALLRDGLRVVLVGQPNVGKSSLLNALAGQDLAIVTAIAGTTRDTVTETIHLQGVPLDIIDTAGLRETQDEVEQIGIARTWAKIEQAQVIIHLQDAANSQPLLDADILAKLPRTTPRLSVMNKADLFSENTALHLAEQAIPQLDKHTQDETIYISAKTGLGLDSLKDALLKIAGYEASAEGVFIARERHILALKHAATELQHAEMCAAQGDKTLDLFAETLRLAQHYLSTITGAFSSDDLLGVIFGKFCIGK